MLFKTTARNKDKLNVALNEVDIDLVFEVFLGIYIDQLLNWKLELKAIDESVSSASYALRALRNEIGIAAKSCIFCNAHLQPCSITVVVAVSVSHAATMSLMHSLKLVVSLSGHCDAAPITENQIMSPDWASLPFLPLRCILEHLSTEDAFAATSTCRHWRSGLAMYEGRKETLKLNAKCIEKNLFLTRMFKRHTRKLLIYLDCKQADLEKLLGIVLPQFFDTAELKELIFIGPSYVHEGQHVPYVKLKRIITESLIFKHSHCLQKLALMGCEMDTAKNDNDRYCHRQVEYYSRPLTFHGDEPGDVLFSSNNASLMVFSTLKHIILDYDQINTAAVETLAHLSNFSHLSLNITGNRPVTLRPVDWNRANQAYEKPVKVALNIISVPSKRFDDIIENVLVDGLTLTSIKVLFCKAMYKPLVAHVASHYQHCLRELVWADSPCGHARPRRRTARPEHMDNYRHVNPFVLLCWQCAHLSRLVIHGYWVWQYDLLGFVRLRGSISHIEVSSVYDKQDKFQNMDEFMEEGTLRVLVGDSPPMMDPAYIHELNAFAEFKWQPPRALHAALRASSSPQQRADYVLREATRPLGVTLC